MANQESTPATEKEEIINFLYECKARARHNAVDRGRTRIESLKVGPKDLQRVIDDIENGRYKT